MSIRLKPLPDHDVLRTSEVAAAFGVSDRIVLQAAVDGRFPGAFRTLGLHGGPGNWRIPRAAVLAVGRELGVWP